MNNATKLPCLRIAVAVPVRGTFSYNVPEQMVPRARVGCRVQVPFNNRKVPGYILEKISPDQDKPLKEILDVLDMEPLFNKKMVPLFEWMAEYYAHPIGHVVQSLLPGGLNMSPYKTAYITESGQKALQGMHVFSEEKERLSWIREHPGKKLPWPVRKVYQLREKGWIVIKDRTNRRQSGPLMRKFLRPREGLDLESLLPKASAGAKNEIEFLEKVFSSRATPLSELTARFQNGPYLAKKWVQRGVLESYKDAVYRDPAGKIMFPSPPPVKLYEQQEHALNNILEGLDKKVFSSCLLYGVTGSGKTEVYCRAIEHLSLSGGQAILMVPEISLAIYMEGLFRSRLGDRVGIYHSGLSQGERYDQWMKMARGELDLVIGARSALFAPLPALGLIIVDEEHDSSYKQDSSPRYQARDTAVVRAKMENALVVLGSGTPSVQSYQNSITGRYHLISMPERVERRPLPDVSIVDMKTLGDRRADNRLLSPELSKAIDQNLAAGNQTILFLNRRGFHRLYLCRSCGQSIRCPNCDVALSYHLKENRLSCHYCGFNSETRMKCPSCGCGGLKPYGFGTEKLEYELKEVFPGAKIARMDTDSTRKKGEALQILKNFSNHEIDMLVGTQMITKGYDFPMVTLVGVIAADLSLGFPDFRAGERTFQTLTQVAGRSGRGQRGGRVIIQTYNPDHYAIRTATEHDYLSFFNNENSLRSQLGYPPFSHLACLRLKGNSQARTADAAKRLTREIHGILAGWPRNGKDIQVLGPAEAPISRLNGKHRWQVLIKSKSSSLLTHLLRHIEDISGKTLQQSGVNLILDVDPYQMS